VDKHRLDGIILSSGTINPIIDSDFYQFLEYLDSFPLVSLSLALDNIPSVIVNNQEGMRSGVEHLILTHGFKKIAFVKGPENNDEANLRFQGYKDALSEHNIPLVDDYILPGNFIPDAGDRAVDILEERNCLDVEAVVCANDDMAINLIKTLEQRGINIPRDIAVLGFDDKAGVEYLKPPMTTIGQPVKQMVRKAYEVVMSLIQGEAVDAVYSIPSELVTRESCSCLPTIVRDWLDKTNDNQEIDLLERIRTGEGFPLEKSEFLEGGYEELIHCFNFEDPKQENVPAFIRKLNQLATKSILDDLDNINWSQFLAELKRETESLTFDNNQRKVLDDLFSMGQGLFSDLFKRREEMALSVEAANNYRHREFKQDLNFINSIAEVVLVLSNHFQLIGLDYGFIVLYNGEVRRRDILRWDIPKTSQLRMHHCSKGCIRKDLPMEITTKTILPDDFFEGPEPLFLAVSALNYKEEQFGYLLQSLNLSDEHIYVTVQEYLSSALAYLFLAEKRNQLEKEVSQTLEELQQSNKKLTNLDDMKNDFIANITHDFRSPLSIIMNNADLGKKYYSENPEQDIQRLNSIHAASSKLKSAIDRLLDLAKMDAEGLKLKIQKTKPKKYLTQLLDFYRSTVISSKIKILESMPPHEIDDFYTDVDKLEEILSNIISNAIKYIDAENGEILIYLEEKADRVEIRIQDNGIGLDQEKLESIFNRFEQVESGRNSVYKGTGLGLAFAKQLTHFLKGTIRAESQGIDKGSTFILEFLKGEDIFDASLRISPQEEISLIPNPVNNLVQISLQEKINQDQIGIEEYLSTPNKTDEFDYRKGLILIVDDNPDIREIEIAYLRGNGYCNFVTAADGKFGIDAAYKYRPDFIICDYNMPNMKGDAFHDNLIGNPDFRKLPLVFVTALADRSLLIDRQRKGAIAYLGKPIDEDELITTVNIHMQKFMEYKEILQQATIDELTGLHNRRNLMNLLRERLSIRSLRGLSLLFFDIDHFKVINDSYGHQTGDKVLSMLGKVVNQSIRSYDIAGRYGGEEFLILLPDTNLNQAVIVGNKLMEKINTIEVPSKGEIIQFTSSFGVCSLLDDQAHVCNKLGIECLEEIYEVTPNKNTDWMDIENKKEAINEIIIEMADNALY
jgi:diguanylate cyclase (GGDEF)-like protein